MHDSTRRRSLLGMKVLGLLTLIALGGSVTAHAQGDATATKTADVSVFGGYTYSNPDYASFYNNGGVGGLDYTRYLHWRIVPSLEARANYNTGTIITEESALGGLRLKMDFGRVHPYANALFGGTEILYKFPPSPNHPVDRAFMQSFGGGVDIDVAHHFQAKFDFQNEFANFGPNGTKPNNADFTLSPTFFTVGIVYVIPFRGRPGEGPRQ